MTLRIVIHNVGHGHSITAFTPTGHVVVVDLGCSSEFSPLDWLRSQTDTIDQLVITHPHGDHIDEILHLESHRFRIRQLWRPKWLTADEVRVSNQSSYREHVDKYLELSATYSHPVPTSNLVGNPDVTGGVTILKFSSPSCGRSNINNHSGVVLFNYLGLKVLIPGDNEPPSWAELLANPKFMQAARHPDVVMASHHGRLSGYCADVFDEQTGIGKPRLFVISDGRVQDTDATDRYSYHARGWTVHSRSGNASRNRSCVTTRTNGFLDIRIGKNGDGSTFLSTEID